MSMPAGGSRLPGPGIAWFGGCDESQFIVQDVHQISEISGTTRVPRRVLNILL
jgi:hypothetical protein